VKGGLSLASVTDGFEFVDPQSKQGFTGAVAMELPLASRVSIAPELGYAMRGMSLGESEIVVFTGTGGTVESVQATEYLTIKYIFPGGSVPSLPRALELLDRHGLHVIEVEELGAHYRRTAEAWLRNFEVHWPEIQAIDPHLFDEHFRRVWTYYLCGVIEGFRAGGGDLNLHHIVFSKGKSDTPRL